MSQENVEIMRQLQAALNRRQPIDTAELLHPDFEMDATRSGIAGLDGVYRGPEEVAQFWRRWFEAWEVVTGEPHNVDAGDKVVSLLGGQHTMKGRASGIEVEMPDYAWVTEFRDGKAARATLYLGEAEALEAAELRE